MDHGFQVQFHHLPPVHGSVPVDLVDNRNLPISEFHYIAFGRAFLRSENHPVQHLDKSASFPDLPDDQPETGWSTCPGCFPQKPGPRSKESGARPRSISSMVCGKAPSLLPKVVIKHRFGHTPAWPTISRTEVAAYPFSANKSMAASIIRILAP